MDWEKEVVFEINEINKIITNFAYKISNEHHKPRDECWEIKFRPAWEEKFVIVHDGYWLDNIWIENKDLLTALKEFKIELENL